MCLAQGFRMWLARIIRPEGAKIYSLAQGSPWVSQQNVLCPEGAGGIEMCMRSDLEPILAVPNGPFRAYCGGEIHPG
jgi:hypothetical protein